MLNNNKWHIRLGLGMIAFVLLFSIPSSVLPVNTAAAQGSVILALFDPRAGQEPFGVNYDSNFLGQRVILDIEILTGFPTLETCGSVNPENVVLTLTIPEQTELVSETDGRGVFDATTHVITWNLGTLDGTADCFGHHILVTIETNPHLPTGTTVMGQATASIGTTTPGDDPTDNTGTVQFKLGYLPVEVFLRDVDTRCSSSGTLSGATSQSGTGDFACNHNLQFAGTTSSSVSLNPSLDPSQTELKIGELDPGSSAVTESFDAQAFAQSDAFCDAEGNCNLENGDSHATASLDIVALNSNPFPVQLQTQVIGNVKAKCVVGLDRADASINQDFSTPNEASCSSSSSDQEVGVPVNFVQSDKFTIVPAGTPFGPGQIDIEGFPDVSAEASAASNNGVTTLGQSESSSVGTIGFGPLAALPPPPSSPIPCPAGAFSTTGNEPCTPAPAGSFVGSPGSTSSILCTAGTFSANPGAVSCTPAPAGSYVPSSGSTSSTLCAAGSYQPNSGQVSCILADLGFFVSSPGAIQETPCPAGTTSDAPGSIVCHTVSPAQQTNNLINAVNGMNLPQGTTTSLDATLNAAINSLNAGHCITAKNQLNAFINEVNAQSGKKIILTQANTLISAAQNILSSLPC